MSQEEPSPAAAAEPLHLFDALGIEIEYMLVDRETLAVKPETDRVLAKLAGEVVSEVETGELAWSNELVLHVIELKSNGPTSDVDGLLPAFERDVRRINAILEPMGGRLMPTAMHPWMDPAAETRLWPHEHSPIYAALDRIFGCQGHGWSNLQALHLNLPFAGDEEFGRLHAAIRLVLPLLPALAASSPIVEGRFTHSLDNRLEFYRGNSRKIPSICGAVVPEPVFTRHDYERRIFEPMYRDVAPHDPEGVLADEFLNARGAIPRFGRGSIEIRVIDVQECPRADLAIAVAVEGVVKLLAEERWCSLEDQQSWGVEPLAAIFRRTVAQADQAVIHDRDYLEALGVTDHAAMRAGELWRHLVAEDWMGFAAPDETWRDTLEQMLDLGPLARRIRGALGPEPEREELHEVYARLCDCLQEGVLFDV
jgi:gamma-glutamyl:cysteine ligase YbdK (ATP-grasp superfamily)